MRKVERLNLRALAGGVAIRVKAVPGASRDGVVAVLGNDLKVTTSAPAERGKANRTVAAILAKALGVKPGNVELLRGRAGPAKVFHVKGITPEQARAILSSL